MHQRRIRRKEPNQFDVGPYNFELEILIPILMRISNGNPALHFEALLKFLTQARHGVTLASEHHYLLYPRWVVVP